MEEPDNSIASGGGRGGGGHVDFAPGGRPDRWWAGAGPGKLEDGRSHVQLSATSLLESVDQPVQSILQSTESILQPTEPVSQSAESFI